jgi:hypothetical protein
MGASGNLSSRAVGPLTFRQLVSADPLLKGVLIASLAIMAYQLSVMVLHPHWLAASTDWLRGTTALVEWIPLALATYALYRARHAAALAWLMFTLAMVVYTFAESAYVIQDLFLFPGNVPFPGTADALYLLQYPFFFAGFALLPGVSRRGQPGITRAKVVLDSLLLMAAGTALSWYFFLAPAYVASMETAIAKAVNLAYPVGDLGLLFGLAVVLGRQGRSSTGRLPLRVLIVAVILLIGADSWYAYENAYSSYASGYPPDAFWVACYVLFALAGLAQYVLARRVPTDAPAEESANEGRRAARVTGGLRLFFPFVAAVLASAILVLRAITAPIGSHDPLTPFTVSFGLIAIVGARLGITVLENERLLKRESQRVEELALANQMAEQQRLLLAERNQRLEQDIAELKEVHARVARGDHAARSSITTGELLPIAGSLNIMLDRLAILVRENADRNKLTQAVQVVSEAAQALAAGDDRALAQLTAPTSTPMDAIAIALSQLRARMKEMHAGLLQLEQARRASRELADIGAQQGQFITSEGTALSGYAGALGRLAAELDRAGHAIEQAPGYATPAYRALGQVVVVLQALARAARQQISEVDAQVIRFAQAEERANLAAIGGRRLAAELDAAARNGGSRVTLGVPGMAQALGQVPPPPPGNLARAATKPMYPDPRVTGPTPRSPIAPEEPARPTFPWEQPEGQTPRLPNSGPLRQPGGERRRNPGN